MTNLTGVEDKVWSALRTVIDPELGVDIVSLGLIYDVRYESHEVEIEMTLTSPGCPLAPVIDQKVREAVAGVVEIKKIYIELVWDPPWTVEMMDEEVREELGV
jgi:metal-sulfur cluster biosynthetic enzyme